MRDQTEHIITKIVTAAPWGKYKFSQEGSIPEVVTWSGNIAWCVYTPHLIRDTSPGQSLHFTHHTLTLQISEGFS